MQSSQLDFDMKPLPKAIRNKASGVGSQWAKRDLTPSTAFSLPEHTYAVIHNMTHRVTYKGTKGN